MFINCSLTSIICEFLAVHKNYANFSLIGLKQSSQIVHRGQIFFIINDIPNYFFSYPGKCPWFK
jgi:hypothetical protein